MDKYCVVGNPIAHSLSPEIHRAFANQTAQLLCYDRLEAPLSAFEASMTAFFFQGGQGCNVTVPFKEAACAFSHDLTPRAKAAGAVNTLIKQPDGRILGDNTDGAGLVADLLSLGTPLKDKRLVILGAGGAVRGILLPLLMCEPKSVVIVNRTLAKADTLVQQFHDDRLSACAWADLHTLPVDVLINGTSMGLSAEALPLPNAWLSEDTFVYDLLYGEKSLPFQHWAKSQGCTHIADGLGMLVQQAAESFSLWRGVRPNVFPVLESLRERISS